MTIRKIELIDELMRHLEEDSTASTITEGDLKYITYAPQLGYRNLIFKYKTMLVLLFDASNGHYQYLCPVSLIDVLIAKVVTKYNANRSDIK